MLYSYIHVFVVSYLVQDIALFNHWDDDAAAAIKHEALHDEDFFKTLPRTTSQVMEWFQSNKDILKRQQSLTLRRFDPDFDLEGMQALMDATQDKNSEEATIECLNDEFAFKGKHSKPVYGIARNPAKKCIVLVFRGSVNRKDWVQDAKVDEVAVPLTSEELHHYVPEPNESLLQDFEQVCVHQGFHEYLFEDSDGATVMEQVTRDVMKLLKEPRNKDYELFITGHSLGAALATNAACLFALSDDSHIIYPIKLVTFASPSTGKEDFVLAFHELEKAGRIQHLRISNDDDMVPQGLSLFGYRHTGIHLNLHKDTYTLDTTSRDDVNDINITHKWFLGNPSHLLQEHKKRLDKSKNELVRYSFDGIFQDPRFQTWSADGFNEGDEA